MSYNDDDSALDELFGTVYGNDPFMGDANSPFSMAENLQIPLHDDTTFNELDYSHYNDSSLSVPVREYASDAPRLSPISNSYSMSSYEMQETQINSVGYNSFEQPVGVINGEYTHPVEDTPPLPALDSHQYSYADEMPSTSGHQLHTSHGSSSSRHHTSSSTSRSHHPPPRHASSSSSQPSRHRPIQPRTSNVAKPKRPEQNQRQVPSSTTVRLDTQEQTKILGMISELQALKEQASAGISGNSERIQELTVAIMNVFQSKSNLPIATPPAPEPRPPPRSSRPSQNHSQSKRMQYTDDPTSPYQPQMMLAPASVNAAPSIYSDYQTNQPVSLQATPVTPQPQFIRVQSVTQTQPIPSTPGKPQVVYAVPTNSHKSGHHSSRKEHQSHHQITSSNLPRVILAPPNYSTTPAPHPPPNVHIIPRQQPPPALQSVKMQAPSKIQQMEIQKSAPHMTIKQSSSNISQVAAQKRNSRMLRLREMFNSLKYGVERPETEEPFKDMSDVLLRLLPYHSVQEPDFKEEELDNIDANILRTSINQGVQVNELKSKILKIIYDEPQVVNPLEEQNLLLFLDTEYERRKLDEEKEFLNDYNREFFVANSPLIPILKGMDIKRPVALPNPPKLVNQYEYYSFNEAPTMVSPVMSPYLMSPSSSSHRSHSPVKSPSIQAHFHSPRLRQKSTADDNADYLENKTTPKMTVKTERRIPEKKEALKQKQPTFIKQEPVETKPAATPIKMKIKQEVAESQPSTSYSEQRPMPSKKMFLNRARNEAPPALRSPPAMMVRPPMEQSNGRDSDGSISPELGDFVPPPRIPFIPKAADIKSSDLKKLAPLPAPQPKKSEVKEAEKLVSKPEVPRPWSKAEHKKRTEPVEKEIKSLKLDNKKEPLEVPPPNGVLRPIKLKLKLGGNTITIEGKDEKEAKKEEKKRKKEKKEKKEKKKKKREERKRKREAQIGEDSENDETKKKEYTSTVVSGPGGGLRLKLKLNPSAPAVPSAPLSTVATVPSTSRVNGYTTKKEDDKPSPPKIPKLKIKFGGNPKENKIELAEAPISKPIVKPLTNGPTLPLFSAQATDQEELPGVTFSDQSDNDEDLMKATDESMRAWGMSFKTSSKLPPFPSSQYAGHVRPSQPPPSSFQL